MHNIGMNEANVAHVFCLKDLSTDRVLDTAVIEQVSPRGQWHRNRQSCQDYLNSTANVVSMFYSHVDTGPIDSMRLLERTIRESYGLGL